MMRVTKKLYALLIAGMMVVSLAGCQSTGNSSNSGNAQSEQSSKQILPPNLYHLTIFRIFQGI